MDGTVLVADDDRTIRTVLTQALTRAGCRVHATSSLTQLLRWVEEGRGDVVISDVRMPDGDGLEMLPHISSLRPDLPVIVISAQNTIMTAIKAAEVSAFDYLPKPFDLPDLMKRTARALNSSAAPRADTVREAGRPGPGAEGAAALQDLPMIGRDSAMQDLYRLVAQVMNTRLPVMITGESGSGKSLVARSIHGLSERGEGPFVTVSAADLSDPEAPARLLAQARGGSIVFEAIEDFDTAAQARLAQVIDREGEGCARLMATSQSSPAQALQDGRLRQDFFYRLDGAGITVPPLRARIEDIALLAEHFLAQAAAAGAPAREIDDEALALLRRHAWPGNVRQLENTLRSLAVTARAPIISRAEVEQALGTQPGESGDHLPEDRQRLADSVAQHLQRYFDLHGDMLPPVGLYERILHEIEMPLIEIALDATGGNQARCADLLGINRNTLRKKMTQLGIRVTRRRKLM